MRRPSAPPSAALASVVVAGLAAVLLLPQPLAAHSGHAPGGPSSIGEVLHYIFSFDHYAGTISVVVAGIAFIAYRNLRRRLKKEPASAVNRDTGPKSQR
jgi:cytochrome bd-type quinol oxidase subunit 1